jgi:hypothetical protein
VCLLLFLLLLLLLHGCLATVWGHRMLAGIVLCTIGWQTSRHMVWQLRVCFDRDKVVVRWCL